MYWFIGLVFLVLVVLLLNWSEAVYNKYKIKIQIKILPSEYENYNYLDKSTIRFGDHELIFLFQSVDPIKNYLTVDNNLIVIANQKIESNDDTHHLRYTFYKYNPLGDLIDSYSYDIENYLMVELRVVDGYLINPVKNYYNTWSIDGDTTPIDIIKINEKFEWSEEDQVVFFDIINNDAVKFFTYHMQINQHTAFDKVFYLLNNKWFVFYRNTIQKHFFYDSNKEAKWLYNLFDYYYTTDKKSSVNPFENIQFIYFHKINYEVHSSYGGGGSGLGSSSHMGAYWRGDLYTHLIVDDDTLKFKDELLLELSSSNGYFMIGDERLCFTRNPKTSMTPYLYYSNSVIEYKLFTRDERQLYMIKKVVN
jgi:hypothetical protein